MFGSFLLGRQMQMLESIYGYLLFSHFPRLKRLSHNTRFVDSSRYYHRRLKDSYPIVESRKPFCTTSPRFRGNRNDTRRYILSPPPLHAIHILIIDPSPIQFILTEEAVYQAQAATKALYESDLTQLKSSSILSALRGDPRLRFIAEQELFETPIAKLAVLAGLSASNCEFSLFPTHPSPPT